MSNPLRLFRKHQKLLLAVFGVALMFAFTVGGIITQFQSSSSSGDTGETVLTWSRGKVTDKDLRGRRIARNQLLAFIQAAQGRARERDRTLINSGIPTTDAEESLVQTMVLAQKARELGVVVSDAAVLDYLRRITGDAFPNPDELPSLLRRTTGGNMTVNQMFAALQEELLAQRMLEIAGRRFMATTPADAWDYHNRFKRRVVIEATPVRVDQEQFLGRVGDPSDEEVLELYEKHKNEFALPGSPDPGFKRLRRVALRYMRADFDTFLQEEMKKVTDEQIRAYYEENKNTFRMPELPELPGDAKPDDSPDATEPTETEPADTEPTETEPTETEPTETKPTETKPTETKPAATEPTETEPAETEPTETEPTETEPTETEPAETEPAETEPTETKPTETKPAATEPTTTEPAATEPAATEPTTTEPTTTEPTTTEPTTTEPTTTEPAETEPAETELPETKPADTKQPGNSVTESAPAVDDPADSGAKVNDVMPAEGDSADSESQATEEDAQEPVPEFQPLEKVADQIRRQIAMGPAQDRLTDVVNKAETTMSGFYDEYKKWKALRDEPDVVEPKPLDFEALSEELGMTTGSTPLITFLDIEDTFQLSPQQAGGLAMIAFREGSAKFKPQRFPSDQDGRVSGDEVFVFWKTEEEEDFVPELDDIRDEVVKAWKLRKALDLAKEQAQKTAGEISSQGQSLKDYFANIPGHEVIETNEFSWMTMGFTPQMRGYSGPELSKVDGIEFAGYDFMKGVFALDVGETGIAVNQPGTIVYIVQIKSETPDAELRREMLLDSSSMYLVEAIAQRQRSQVVIEWAENLEKEMDVEWKRDPFPDSRVR